jgi:geranylgeranyl diphosphate synthase type II
MGVLASGIRQETEALLEAAGQYAEHLGLAFQIRDDLLDVTSTTEELGKPVGSDSANGKHTFVTLLGQDACVRMVEEQTVLAKQALAHTMDDSGFLCWLADELAGRTH